MSLIHNDMNDMISNDMKIKIWTFIPVKNIFNQNNNKIIKIKCIKSFYDEKIVNTLKYL